MRITSLSVNNFKNIEEARLEFSPRLNCLLGHNGMGKSNLLDAIYYLSFCRSFTGAPDSLLTTRGSDFTLLQGTYVRKDADEDLSLSLGGGHRKTFKRGGKDYKRLSAHIGLFPAVLISPADSNLVMGSGEERRRYLDMVISQGDVRYLDALIRYNSALEQRNRLLRDGNADTNLYLAIEAAMLPAADYIMTARRNHIAQLADLHTRYYRAIAGDDAETTEAVYKSSVAGDSPGLSFADALERNRSRDHALRYTSVGPQRDDMELLVNGMPLRRTGSQGQQKTFTIALRLAQYDFLAHATGIKPLLLLDDIFDKLDARRVEAIINLVTGTDFGQIFITDTNRKHLDEILSRVPADHALWSVDNGVFSPIAT